MSLPLPSKQEQSDKDDTIYLYDERAMLLLIAIKWYKEKLNGRADDFDKVHQLERQVWLFRIRGVKENKVLGYKISPTTTLLKFHSTFCCIIERQIDSRVWINQACPRLLNLSSVVYNKFRLAANGPVSFNSHELISSTCLFSNKRVRYPLVSIPEWDSTNSDVRLTDPRQPSCTCKRVHAWNLEIWNFRM